MPALRLLSQLFLVALGTTLGAFTISGYFDPHMQHGQTVAAVAGPTAPADRSTLAIAKPRKRFVAVDAKSSPKSAVAKSAKLPPKKNQLARDQAAKEKRPRQASTQPPWPWGLFSN